MHASSRAGALVRVAVPATCWLALGVSSVAGQVPASGTLRVAVVTSPDTVLVGQPFVVGVLVETADSLEFPALLETSDDWEQSRLVRVDASRPNEQRAYYELVAWKTGRLTLPSLTMSAVRTGQRHTVALPGPFVQSVIPADVEEPLLRPPRPPLRRSSPWGMILLGALLAALALWWWWNRNRPLEPAVEEEVDTRPRTRALSALAALRERAERGEIAAAAFYDGLEAVLREYLVETRAWPASHPVREARETSVGAMHELHRRAVLARFAAVVASRDELIEDADASYSWVLEDAA